MPKITVHGGPSGDGAEPVLVGEQGPELAVLPEGSVIHPAPKVSEQDEAPAKPAKSAARKPRRTARAKQEDPDA